MPRQFCPRMATTRTGYCVACMKTKPLSIPRYLAADKANTVSKLSAFTLITAENMYVNVK